MAATSHRSVKLTVKLDPQDLSHIWLSTERGLLRIPNVQAEKVLLEGLTLGDWKSHLEDEGLRTDAGRQARDQHELDKLVRKAETSRRAANEKKREEQFSSGTRVPRKKQSLRQNRSDEMKYLKNGELSGQAKAIPGSAVPVTAVVADAADAAMEGFLHGVRG
jgi:hypothetical protein